MSNTRYNDESGRSMIEMLGVLAIIGVLSVGGISGYTSAMSKFKIGKSRDQIQHLIVSIKNLYATQADYAGASVTSLITHDVIPLDMRASATTAVSPYGSAVKIGKDAAGAAVIAGGLEFMITYEGLPLDACIALATNNWGDASGSGLVSITVGTHAAFTWTAGTLPVSLADSTSALACVTASTPVSLAFR
ncbi:MAG: hypothetical protein KAJ75_03335 [Alphaproteobacteria bacterium]|nr:hypothetical protein [Alphaproteobacteria bacterium]